MDALTRDAEIVAEQPAEDNIAANLRQVRLKLFPAGDVHVLKVDAILAEESGEHPTDAGTAPTAGRGRVWVIDPLDGTVNYANGIPFFCVSIALAIDGRAAAGDTTRTVGAAAV